MPNEETIVTTAQTNGDVTEPAGNAAAGEQTPATEPTETTAGFEDGAGGAEDKTDDGPIGAKDAEHARKRRAYEKRQAELKEARESAIIEALGGKNPYTGGEIKDSADVEEFLAMRDIEKKGGDPVSDFAKFHKQKRKEEADKAKAEEEDAEYVQSDLDAFREAYPDVGIEQLLSDEAFLDYADGKLEKKVPLAKIYEGYTRLVGNSGNDARKKAEAKAAQALANKQSSPGSAHSTATASDAPYTPEDVKKMSPAEVSKNYDKIIRDMKTWK